MNIRNLSTLLFILVSGHLFSQSIDAEVMKAVQEDNTYALNEILNSKEYNINSCFELKGTKYNIVSLAIKLDKKIVLNRCLFDRQLDLNAYCEDKTPLMYAVKYGNKDAVKMLLDKGADINATSKQGKTAMDYAEKYEQKEIAKMLKQ